MGGRGLKFDDKGGLYKTGGNSMTKSLKVPISLMYITSGFPLLFLLSS